MNPTIEQIKAFAQLEIAIGRRGPSIHDWLLQHGQEFNITEHTFDIPRGEQGQCFMNATHLVMSNHKYTYCEGKVSIYGIAIDHAWVCDANGNVIEPTLTKEPERIEGYYGVPFDRTYLRRSILKNGYYGLLDGFYARKTVRRLVDGKVKNFRAEIARADG